jgi:hypothetical protein
VGLVTKKSLSSYARIAIHLPLFHLTDVTGYLILANRFCGSHYTKSFNSRRMAMIKKFITIAAVSAFMFFSCGDDDKSVGPQDSVAPAPVANLAVSDTAAFSLILTWTAAGDDDTAGTASIYDIRYSLDSITDDNWNLAHPITGESAPKPFGGAESLIVTGLNPDNEYYFAIRVGDERPNWSDLSNSTSAATLDTGVIWPFKINNEWIGTITGYNPDGSEIGSAPLDYVIIGDSIIQNQHWFRIGVRSGDTLLYYILGTNRADGFYEWSASAGQAILSMKYPATAGDTYAYGSFGSITVVSTDSIIVRPNGSYTCHFYRHQAVSGGMDFESALFMSVDAGFIWRDQYTEDSLGQMYLGEQWVLDTLVLE